MSWVHWNNGHYSVTRYNVRDTNINQKWRAQKILKGLVPLKAPILKGTKGGWKDNIMPNEHTMPVWYHGQKVNCNPLWQVRQVRFKITGVDENSTSLCQGLILDAYRKGHVKRKEQIATLLWKLFPHLETHGSDTWYLITSDRFFFETYCFWTALMWLLLVLNA